MPFNLRKRVPLSYYEPDEPKFDEYLYIPKPLKTQKTIIQSQEIHTEEYFNIIEEDTKESNSNQTVSEITDTNINSQHAKVSENKLIDPSSMETEKPENLLDQASIEDFKFFKTIDENLSKSPTNTEINTRIDSPKENNGKILQKCEFCNKIMTRKHYNSHKQKHLNPDRYSCPFCSYKTFRRYALNQHIGKHTKKYKYSCDYCSFETNYGRNFRQHREKHENGVVQPKTPVRITEKICQVCGFKSFSRSVIECHRKKHRNVKFSCDLCSFTTFHKFSLKRHCYSVHPSK
ncbi:hypothetical protein HF086_002493 [Spodoptera exigua]|uniref:C2H2-type domain-containing protein n=1 Tax=Spodoptera exigua TaxID=7107 RepID=A0A922MG29_SPOEX|nr:hypothetical protein HF086_002493 [Spodoptera exigua]